MKVGPYFKRGLLISGILLLADQISKWWVLNGLKLPEVGSIELLPFLNFTMVWNYGISMGLPIGDSLGKWGIVILTAGISMWLLNWLRTTERKLEGLGLAIILGGAIGNIIDRFLHGAVVDFIHLHAFSYNFYVFNVADSAITIGVILLLIDGLLEGRKGPKNALNADQADN
ncbi:signal peptidase II [Kordiimonas sp. SCSIO 12603]|uniref:signal peptidase II n=1 Tax=Kordiimonas sp. SCSIO 12603 TaxID=2829596 RepID=UPI0021054EF6|nr:signal peptidase II [Kordiimonas sp. SCSIO 12603]UTW58427.1 signal peptidase II [Kordiimonas sp. SCSIO 12603]